MQLTCKVNQAEAIRRGFDANSTVKLEIDPAALTPEERATLADNFSSGEFKQGYTDRQIPEPTAEGFLETLRLQVAKAAQDKSNAENRRIKAVAAAGENFSKRQTTRSSSEMTANFIDGTAQLCGTYQGDDETRVRMNYTFLEPHNSYGSSDEEWTHLLATDEGQAWLAELEQTNALAKATTETAIIAACHQKSRKIAEKAARLANFRQWALTHGSETVRLRAEEGFEWQSLADREWADSLLTQAGITDTHLPAMPGYDQDSDESEQPTAAQINNLRRIREALARLPEVPTEVALRDFTYTEEIPDQDNMGQDPEVIHRTEVRVKITTPTGSEVTRYFQA